MLDIVARLKDLTAAVNARFQVHVVRTAQLARIRVFDVGVHRQAVVRTAHTRAGLGFLTLGDCHDGYPELLRLLAHVNWKRASYRPESDFARLLRHPAGLFFSPARPGPPGRRRVRARC